ncbi:hypothetical protein J4G02_16740, partial [Candidatus Poribacteria bacterium]|nr:hypothetical protein [Candidatus Poribacteria bacterium]
MKKGIFLGFNLLSVSVFLVSSTLAQDSPQWHLPKGAKARLGKGRISNIAYSPDGNYLAVAASTGVWIYDVHTGAELELLTGHTAEIESLAFSPDGDTLASGSDDGTVLLWNVAPLTNTSPQIAAYDVNQDGIVNLVDLATVGTLFGQTGERLSGNVNGDGMVNIFDLVAVSAHLEETTISAAPVGRSGHRVTPIGVRITPKTVQNWIALAQTADDGSPIFRRGIANLEAVLAMLTPAETALLPNYPNPFNPETWIPYRLAHAADVTLTIYDIKGAPVRRLDLGHQPAGYYTDQAKAA